MVTKEWLSPQEYAAMYGLKVRLVYDLIRHRRLPATKFGRLWRIHKDAIPDMSEHMPPANVRKNYDFVAALKAAK